MSFGVVRIRRQLKADFPATTLKLRISSQDEHFGPVFRGGLHRRIHLLLEKFSTKRWLVDLHLDVLVTHHDASYSRLQQTLGLI